MKSITLANPSDETNRPWLGFRRHLLGLAPNLQHLSVLISPSPELNRKFYLATLLEKATDLKHLESVTITTQFEAGQRRPSDQCFDLVRFLRPSKASLKALKVSNVLFSREQTPSLIRDTHDLMDTLVDFDLDSIDFIVNHMECHESCPQAEHGGSIAAECACQVYSICGATTRKFDVKVQEMKIAVDKRTGAWDFGEYVVRKKKQIMKMLDRRRLDLGRIEAPMLC